MIYALPLLTVLVALLMVSQVRYPHVVNVYLKGRKPFNTLIQVLFYILLAVWKWQVALVLIFWLFVASGMVKSVWGRLTHHGEPLPSEDIQNMPTPQGPNPSGT